MREGALPFFPSYFFSSWVHLTTGIQFFFTKANGSKPKRGSIFEFFFSFSLFFPFFVPSFFFHLLSRLPQENSSEAVRIRRRVMLCYGFVCLLACCIELCFVLCAVAAAAARCANNTFGNQVLKLGTFRKRGRLSRKSVSYIHHISHSPHLPITLTHHL